MEDSLTKLLCCPSCQQGEFPPGKTLICSRCLREFPVVNGRPVFSPEVGEGVANEQSALLTAASSLPVRSLISPIQIPKSTAISEVFYKILFPQFKAKDPHWKFLGRKVIEMVSKIPTGALVLDIGAGECKYSALLPQRRYVGTDLVFSSDKHDFSRIDVIANASALPFRDGIFDVALNLVVLEHVPDPDLVVREMARVLKADGLAFALIPLVRPEHLAPYDFQRFTRYGIERLFKRNGLRITSIEGSNGALWTAVQYTSAIAKTQPLIRYGSRSIMGIFWNRFWAVILWPLMAYARMSDSKYGPEFPIYYWVQATKSPAK